MISFLCYNYIGDYMMIDTHCHLDKTDYDNLDKIIKNMGNNIMIASGCNDETNQNVIELVNKYPNIYGTLGIHPEEIDKITVDSFKLIEDNMSNPKIVGIGEIGLDYYWNQENKEEQKEIFVKQLKLATKYDKTVVIHSRDAIEDTYNILKDRLKTKAVIHCYSSSVEMAYKFLDFNVCFGIGGVVTFKNGKVLKDVVEKISLDRLLLETDSPYLTPEPYRKMKNEPYNIIYVAEKIAEIKGLNLEKALFETTKNAIRQFDLPIKL